MKQFAVIKRTVLALACVGLAAAGVAQAATQTNPDPLHIVFNNSLGGYEVRGAANPALDPRNIQWAVDRSDGGAVFLRQTFDFGTRTVFITKNVKLVASSGASPVIKNGGDPKAGHNSPYQSAIYVGWNGQALSRPPAHGLYGSQEHPRFPGVVQYFPAFPVTFSIQGLRFQDCARSAIIVGACTGATIEGNTFTNMKWSTWDQWYVSEPQFRSLAMIFSGGFCSPYLGLTSTSSLDAASLQSASRSVSGPVRIRNNTIEVAGRGEPLSGFDRDLAQGVGIAIADTSADVIIENNRIGGIALDTGVNLLFNLGPRSLVANNLVSDAASYGIFGWSYLFTCTFTITGNTVNVGGPDSGADGIAIEGDTYGSQTGDYVISDGTVTRSEISHNTITMNGSGFGAISLYDHCVRTLVTDNTIQGSAAWAIGSIILEDTETAEQNTFSNNSIVPSFQGDIANILLMPSVSRCLITRNTIGGGGTAGVLCQGDHNSILANDYSRSGYLGFAEGAGCVLLDTDTAGNFVGETRFPAGTDVCGQVQDLGSNFVLGAGDCR